MIVEAQLLDRRSLVIFGKERLRLPADVVRNETVGRPQNGFGAAVVLFEPHDARVREIVFESQNIADLVVDICIIGVQTPGFVQFRQTIVEMLEMAEYLPQYAMRVCIRGGEPDRRPHRL